MTSKEEWKAKTDRLERARLKAEEFVAAGGDLKSKDAVPIGMELVNAFNEVSTLFGHPILKDIGAQSSTPGGYLQQVIDQETAFSLECRESTCQGCAGRALLATGE